MKRFFQFSLTVLLLCMAVISNAQIRAGGNKIPNTSEILDLNPDESNNAVRGLALPCVKLVSTTNYTPLTAHVVGMCVMTLSQTKKFKR